MRSQRSRAFEGMVVELGSDAWRVGHFGLHRPKIEEIWKLKYPRKELSDWSADGFTTWETGDEVVSTVFPGPYGGEGYAMLIFHEIMHMKLRMGRDMHSMGGLASSCVSRNCDTPVTGLSKDNIGRMRGALGKSVKQWSAGPGLVFQKAQQGS